MKSIRLSNEIVLKALRTKNKEEKIEELIHTCEEIDLDAIKTLREGAVGTHIYEFKNIKSVSKPMADALIWLCQSPVGTLSFESLNEISQLAAEKIAYTRGNLKLGLHELKKEIAAALVNLQGNLEFNRLKEIPDEVMAFVSSFKAKRLVLSGLLNLSDQGAEYLVGYKGILEIQPDLNLSEQAKATLLKRDKEKTNLIWKDDYGAIEKNIQVAFAHQVCDRKMVLAAIEQVKKTEPILVKQTTFEIFSKNITLDACEELSKINDPDLIPLLCKLSLPMLLEIGPAEARALVENAKIKEISFDRLSVLTSETARALAHFPGNLTIGINNLSPESAKEIALHKGTELKLNKINELGDSQASALSKYQGFRLSLSGLQRISDSVALLLQAFEGVLMINPEVTISKKARETLSQIKKLFWVKW
jgi:hypothetical protein